MSDDIMLVKNQSAHAQPNTNDKSRTITSVFALSMVLMAQTRNDANVCMHEFIAQSV
jgi:hypothetical protein